MCVDGSRWLLYSRNLRRCIDHQINNLIYGIDESHLLYLLEDDKNLRVH